MGNHGAIQTLGGFRTWGVFSALVLPAAVLVVLVQGMAQQDEGPVLKPKKSPTRPAPTATLLVMCDLACNWKLDGDAKGNIESGGSAKTKVELGEHLVVAVTEDSLDTVQQLPEVKAAGQKIVSLELKPVREARLRNEKAALDKAAQQEKDRADKEARDRAEQEARDKAAQETSDNVALEQKERDQRAALDHEVELAKAGMTLYSYPTDGFSAYFPSNPRQRTSSGPNKYGFIRTHDYQALTFPLKLEVEVFDIDPTVASKDPDSMIQEFNSRLQSGERLRLISEKKITLGTHHGAEFEGENSFIRISVRDYLVGTRFYFTAVLAAHKKPDANTSLFLDSFKLIEGEQAGTPADAKPAVSPPSMSPAAIESNAASPIQAASSGESLSSNKMSPTETVEKTKELSSKYDVMPWGLTKLCIGSLLITKQTLEYKCDCPKDNFVSPIGDVTAFEGTSSTFTGHQPLLKVELRSGKKYEFEVRWGVAIRVVVDAINQVKSAR